MSPRSSGGIRRSRVSCAGGSRVIRRPGAESGVAGCAGLRTRMGRLCEPALSQGRAHILWRAAERVWIRGWCDIVLCSRSLRFPSTRKVCRHALMTVQSRDSIRPMSTERAERGSFRLRIAGARRQKSITPVVARKAGCLQGIAKQLRSSVAREGRSGLRDVCEGKMDMTPNFA